jgi:hypothetical protein
MVNVLWIGRSRQVDLFRGCIVRFLKSGEREDVDG